MEYLEEINKLIEASARKMADEEIKNYPVHVSIDGKEVDWDSCIVKGGEIFIEISAPMYLKPDKFGSFTHF